MLFSIGIPAKIVYPYTDTWLMRWGEIIILSLIIGVLPAGILAFVLGKFSRIQGNEDLVVFVVAWFICWLLVGIKLYKMQDEANNRKDFN